MKQRCRKCRKKFNLWDWLHGEGLCAKCYHAREGMRIKALQERIEKRQIKEEQGYDKRIESFRTEVEKEI